MNPCKGGAFFLADSFGEVSTFRLRHLVKEMFLTMTSGLLLGLNLACASILIRDSCKEVWVCEECENMLCI